MNYVQRGLYRDLLDEQWEKGSVSGDIEDMADICGCPIEVMASAWPVLIKCFDEVDGRFINATLEEQRTAKDAERLRRSESGRLGGMKKAERNQEKNSKCLAPAKQLLAPSQEEKRREEKRGDERREKEGETRTPPLPGTPQPPKLKKKAVLSDRPQDVPEQLWTDFLIHRKAKKAPVTKTIMNTFREQAAIAGISIADALLYTMKENWQGFRADWYKNREAGRTPSAKEPDGCRAPCVAGKYDGIGITGGGSAG
jgi:uncharacterized protein YdaU (DUF1376 family)